MAKVFISYASADKSWAERLQHGLERLGHVALWMPKFRTGEAFPQTIAKTMEESDRMAAIWSPDYFNSHWCMKEFSEGEVRESESASYLSIFRIANVEAPGNRSLSFADIAYLDDASLDDLIRKEFGEITFAPPSEGGPEGTPALDNLPKETAHFFGREDDLETLAKALIGSNALINQQALRGLGGIGKTTLARHFAASEAAKARYPLRWWIPAERAGEAASALTSLAIQLELAGEKTPPEEAMAALNAWFKAEPRAALLIFDNVEDPRLLREMAPEGAHILATTRRAGLGAGVKTLELGIWEQATTAAFLLDRTGSGDAAAAEGLAEALQGLPLAAEHAAAIIEATGMPLDRYAALFEAQDTSDLDDLIEDHHYPTPVAKTFLMALDRAAAQSEGARDILTIMAALSPAPMPVAVFCHEGALETLQTPGRVEAAIAALMAHGLVGRADVPDDVFAEKVVDCLSAHRLVLQAAHREEDLPMALEALAQTYPEDIFTNYDAMPLMRRLAAHADDDWAKREWQESVAKHTILALDSSGYFSWAIGDHQTARRRREAALVIAEASFGSEATETATQLSNLSIVLHDLGGADNLTLARTHLERALTIDEAALGKNHPKVAAHLSNLANVLGDLGGADNLTFARADLERALAIDEASLGKNHPNVARDLSNLANVLLTLGGADNLTLARTHLDRAAEIYESKLGPNHPELGICITKLAEHLRTEDPAKALAYAERGHTIFTASLGPDHPHTKRAQSTLDSLRLPVRLAFSSASRADSLLNG